MQPVVLRLRIDARNSMNLQSCIDMAFKYDNAYRCGFSSAVHSPSTRFQQQWSESLDGGDSCQLRCASCISKPARPASAGGMRTASKRRRHARGQQARASKPSSQARMQTNGIALRCPIGNGGAPEWLRDRTDASSRWTRERARGEFKKTVSRLHRKVSLVYLES